MNTIAKIISRITGPLLGLPLWIILIVIFSNTLIEKIISEIIILFAVIVAIPAFYLIIALRKKKISDIEMSKRNERPFWYILVTFFSFLGTAVSFWLKFPEEVIGFLFALSSLLLVYSAITFFWKISMHMLSAVIWTTLFGYIFGPWWFLLGVIVIPVAWARMYLKLHTFAQVSVSFFLAILVLMFAFALYPRHEYTAAELNKNQGKFIEVEGVNIHYIEQGQGEPMLFIHGFALSAEAWKNQLDEFSKSYRVIALDLPGFGYSGRSMELDYARSSQADFVSKFMGALHISCAIVVGHSMGGGIAANLALSHPEKVNKLVLVDSSGYEKVPERWGAINVPIFDRFVARFFIMNRFAAIRLFNKAFANDKKISESLIEQFLKPSYVQNSLQVLIKMTLDQRTENFPAKIKNIKQKTFIIWGREDEMFGTYFAEKYHFDIKNSQLVIMPDVGHIPFMEQPDQFNAYLNEFLKQK
jgi:pimeloyl-ACP methyl ester carboxylesterase/membrane-associated phospholipid phosphatase